MSAKTGIEWTDATWTPIRARYNEIQSDGSGKERIGWHCEHVSEGCRNCYAESINRRLGTGLLFKPGNLFREEKRGYANGEAKLFLDEKMLWAPVGWTRPRMIFVCSMTDLFADFVEDDWIGDIWEIMRSCRQHTFQVLTKRPQRMRDYVNGMPAEYAGLPNVWLGVSAEDQATAEQRIPLLLNTAAARHFASLEPLLGPIDLTWLIQGSADDVVIALPNPQEPTDRVYLDWVIAGGESGPGARPAHPDWFRRVRDQCQAASVPFFFKQFGAWAPAPEASADSWKAHKARGARDSHCFPDGIAVELVGKKAAGALLDGREWREMPAYAEATAGRPA